MLHHGRHSPQRTKLCPKSSVFLCCLWLVADGRVCLVGAWLGRVSGEVPVLQLCGELCRKGPSAHTDQAKQGQILANSWARGPSAFPEERTHSFLVSQVCVAPVRWSYRVRQVLPGLSHCTLSTNLPLKKKRFKMLMEKETQGHWMSYNQFCRRGKSLLNFPSVFPWNAPCVLDQLIQLPQPQNAVVLANLLGSHFLMPSLKSSKLKHLDEPRKKLQEISLLYSK